MPEMARAYSVGVRDLDTLLRGSPRQPVTTFRDLGRSRLAQAMDAPRGNLTGKWCSNCKGIWFGLPGECECPKCGNRHG